MNQQEAAALLSIAAAFDNRKPDPDAATAWAHALHDLNFADCRDAIVAHYRRSSEWLMPNAVIAEVKRIRRKRIADYGPIPAPTHIDPDDTRALAAYMTELTRLIADGNPPPKPRAIESAPVPDEFRKLREKADTNTREGLDA